MRQFLENLAAMIVALGVIAGAGAGAYVMLDEQYKVATIGWVLSMFGPANEFTTLTTANININYHEKRLCEGESISLTDRKILADSYKFYAQIEGSTHPYKNGMTDDEVCADRDVPNNRRGTQPDVD